MSGDILEQAMEQTDFQRVMIRNGNMVLSATLSNDLDMRAGLSPRFIAQVPKRTDQLSAAAISGDLHAASTSSRT